MGSSCHDAAAAVGVGATDFGAGLAVAVDNRVVSAVVGGTIIEVGDVDVGDVDDVVVAKSTSAPAASGEVVVAGEPASSLVGVSGFGVDTMADAAAAAVHTSAAAMTMNRRDGRRATSMGEGG